MAITLTIDDVKSVYPTSQPDFIIQGLIDRVSTVFDCLAGYGESTGKAIAAYWVAHNLATSAGGDIQSQSSANGASVSYNNKDSGDGLKSTQYGRTAYQLDTNGCLLALEQDTFFMLTIGDNQ